MCYVQVTWLSKMTLVRWRSVWTQWRKWRFMTKCRKWRFSLFYFQGSGGWSNHLCGCFNNFQICLTTFLLPCVTFGTTSEQVGECNCIVGGKFAKEIPLGHIVNFRVHVNVFFYFKLGMCSLANIAMAFIHPRCYRPASGSSAYSVL